MEDLDNKWILHSGGADCSDSDDNSPATLGLDNMRGVFILVGAGGEMHSFCLMIPMMVSHPLCFDAGWLVNIAPDGELLKAWSN